MDYRKMSDFEINRDVGAASGEAKSSEPLLNLVIRNSTGRRYDPCNNPADAWSIIEQNGICIGYDGISWDASCPLRDIKPVSDWREHPYKPLRMAMIVYLMMQEGAVKNKDTGKWYCDFCGKSQDETEIMIAAPNEMGICNRCVSECNEIILRQIRTQQTVKPLKQQGGE